MLLVAFVFLFVQTMVMKFLGYAASGFTTVIALQLVIGGILMMSVGVIGIYIEKIYEEVKARPRYIVQQLVEHGVNVVEVNQVTINNNRKEYNGELLE